MAKQVIAKAEKSEQEYAQDTVQTTFTGIDTEKVKATPKKDEWVIKDRLYELTTGRKPLIYTLPTKHSNVKSLLWFDPEKGYQRELRYATNQRSVFVDEQEGQVILGRIVLKNGAIRVPKEQVALQKFLSLYHPAAISGVIKEYQSEAIATNEVDWIEFELEALNMAKDMDIDEAEGILRVEMGSKVTKLSSKELKRDLLVFARNYPEKFMQLATDDNTQLRNIGIRAVEAGILALSGDQRTFTYGVGGRKLMTIPFDEHPYSALSAYFKTDEGMEVFKAIQKRL